MLTKNQKKTIKKKRNEIMDKKQKIVKLFEHHADTFLKLQLNAAPKFFPKMAYPYNGEQVISFFPSEVAGNMDIYTEFVSRDYESEDPSRTLYKWKYNSNYADEYDVAEPHAAHQSVRYLIPTKELIKVQSIVAESSVDNLEFELPDPDSDLPIDQLTIRDFAAIMTGKPVSRKNWLNDIIKK